MSKVSLSDLHNLVDPNKKIVGIIADNNVCNATNTIWEKNKPVTNVVELLVPQLVTEITPPLKKIFISDNKLELLTEPLPLLLKELVIVDSVEVLIVQPEKIAVSWMIQVEFRKMKDTDIETNGLLDITGIIAFKLVLNISLEVLLPLMPILMNTNYTDIFATQLLTVALFLNLEDVKNVKRDTMSTLKEPVLLVPQETGTKVRNLSSKIPPLNKKNQTYMPPLNLENKLPGLLLL